MIIWIFFAKLFSFFMIFSFIFLFIDFGRFASFCWVDLLYYFVVYTMCLLYLYFKYKKTGNHIGIMNYLHYELIFDLYSSIIDLYSCDKVGLYIYRDFLLLKEHWSFSFLSFKHQSQLFYLAPITKSSSQYSLRDPMRSSFLFTPLFIYE